jgi:transposase-like protein
MQKAEDQNLPQGMASIKHNSLYNNQDQKTELVVKGKNDLKKIQEYCNPLFCISCTYFQQTKGNFGRCMVIQKNEKFDGTKKDSACGLWRLDPEIRLDIQLEQRQERAGGYKSPSLIAQKKIHHPHAYEFNEMIRQVKKEKRLKEFAEVTDEIIRKLNPKMNAISEKSGVFHYYYNSKTPAHIIDYILLLLSQDTQIHEIPDKVRHIYHYNVSIRFVKLVNLKWNKGLFRQIPDLMRKEIDTICPKCSSEYVVKNGYGYTKTQVVQRIECKRCNYKFRPESKHNIIDRAPIVADFIIQLYYQKLSNRKIAKWLYKNLGIKYSHTTIFHLIRKLIPKDQRLPNQHAIYKNQKKIERNFKRFIRLTNKIKIITNNLNENNPIPEAKLDLIIKPLCTKCNSANTIQNGTRKNKSGVIQRFLCKSCNYKFTLRDPKYKGMKYNGTIIERALELFRTEKLSTHQISQRIKFEYNIEVEHNSIGNWIKRFIPNAIFYTNGSHRKDIREKISKAQKLRFENLNKPFLIEAS